jgi:flavodoxin
MEESMHTSILEYSSLYIHQEETMKTFVVYASHFGNTERLARKVAATLKEFGPTEVVQTDSTQPVAWEEVDLLVAASPTEGFRQLPAMRSFLESLSPQALEHLSIACFDTRVHMPWPLNGSAVKDMARRLHQKGVKLLVPPESFYVQSIKGTQGAVLLAGEEERAVQWARSLQECYLAAHPPVAASS